MVKDIIDDSIVDGIRKDGLGMEFIYSDEQELHIKGDGFQPFKYYKLYFSLTSQRRQAGSDPACRRKVIFQQI